MIDKLRYVWNEIYLFFKLSKSESEQRRQLIQLEQKMVDAETEIRQSCPHLQGSNLLSEFVGTLTSIVWHQLDRDGDIIGICTNCLRIFRPADSDYNLLLSKRSGNRPSAGGVGVFNLSNALRLDSESFENQEPPKKSKKWAKELDDLSDEEIFDLMDQTRNFCERRKKKSKPISK